MDALTLRFSVTELSQRILEMASTGVYRESLFETFKPVATRRQIRDAIALAKQYGLHSEPTLRDHDLGTYYQVSTQQYQAFQSAVKVSGNILPAAVIATQLSDTTQTVKTMVRVVAGVAIALLACGSLSILKGKFQVGVIFWSSALFTGFIWVLQRQLAHQILSTQSPMLLINHAQAKSGNP